MNTIPTRDAGLYGATQPISTEKKEIRTINGNLSEEPVRQKKFVMAGGPRRPDVCAKPITVFQSVLIVNEPPLYLCVCLLPKKDFHHSCGIIYDKYTECNEGLVQM